MDDTVCSPVDVDVSYDPEKDLWCDAVRCDVDVRSLASPVLVSCFASHLIYSVVEPLFIPRIPCARWPSVHFSLTSAGTM